MNKLTFKNAALGFLIAAVIGTGLSYFVPDFIESAILMFGLLAFIIIFYIWLTIFVLEKITGIKMSIWSAVGYVFGVTILTVIILIPVAIVGALLGISETNGAANLAGTVLVIVAYSLLAGFLFSREYGSEDQADSEE